MPLYCMIDILENKFSKRGKYCQYKIKMLIFDDRIYIQKEIEDSILPVWLTPVDEKNYIAKFQIMSKIEDIGDGIAVSDASVIEKTNLNSWLTIAITGIVSLFVTIALVTLITKRIASKRAAKQNAALLNMDFLNDQSAGSRKSNSGQQLERKLAPSAQLYYLNRERHSIMSNQDNKRNSDDKPTNNEIKSERESANEYSSNETSILNSLSSDQDLNVNNPLYDRQVEE
ncbi:hypothetical protein GJ496_006029 [Pomphorhynchus laevis]|nr:hypothetical protein GJ496_006029 [Pomphorhynchus laevis]